MCADGVACLYIGYLTGSPTCMYRCALGVQLLIIYIDAGWGKLTSP